METKFTAAFTFHNGKVKGEISVQCQSFEIAGQQVKEILGDRGIWSIMWNDSGDEVFNNEVYDFTPFIDINH